MAQTKLYTFAITKAEISANADSATPAVWTLIPITAEGTVEYTIQKAEVADGEGALQITWRHTQRARITLRTKLMLFRILEMISGNPVSSVGANGDRIEFGNENEISPPFVRLRLQQKAVNYDTNAEGYVEAIVYKAQGELPSFTMREVTPGEYTVMFDALKALFDDTGAALPAPGVFGHFKGLKPTLS